MTKTLTRSVSTALFAAAMLASGPLMVGCTTGSDRDSANEAPRSVRSDTGGTQPLNVTVSGMESPQRRPTGNTGQLDELQDFDEEMPVGQLPSIEWPLDKLERNARTLMTNDQRRELDQIREPENRKQYLRESGIAAAVDMAVVLEEGMSLEDVRARFTRATGHRWAEEPVSVGNSERWGFKRYNGAGYTVLNVAFVDGTLSSWSSYPEQVILENQEIRAEATRMTNEITRVLKPLTEGGTPPTIDSLAPFLQNWSFNRARGLYPSNQDRNPVRRLETAAWNEEQATFQAQLAAWDLISARRFPDADAEFAEHYVITLAEPDATRSEASRTIYRYDHPFADRTIHLFLVFDERRLTGWYATPADR